jgi:hypothetical protein
MEEKIGHGGFADCEAGQVGQAMDRLAGPTRALSKRALLRHRQLMSYFRA